MPAHRPVFRWECCKCGSDNSCKTDQGCAGCCNHWRSSCCYVYDAVQLREGGGGGWASYSAPYSSPYSAPYSTRPDALSPSSRRQVHSRRASGDIPETAPRNLANLVSSSPRAQPGSSVPVPVPLVGQYDNRTANSPINHTGHPPSPLSNSPVASRNTSQRLELPPDQSSGYVQWQSGFETSSEQLHHTPLEIVPSSLNNDDSSFETPSSNESVLQSTGPAESQKKATSALNVVTGKENIGPNTSSRKELGALSGLKIAADDSDIPKSRELDVASKTDEESTDEPAATVQIEHQAAEDRWDGGWGATACGTKYERRQALAILEPEPEPESEPEPKIEEPISKEPEEPPESVYRMESRIDGRLDVQVTDRCTNIGAEWDYGEKMPRPQEDRRGLVTNIALVRDQEDLLNDVSSEQQGTQNFCDTYHGPEKRQPHTKDTAEMSYSRLPEQFGSQLSWRSFVFFSLFLYFLVQDVGRDVGVSFSNACARVSASANLRFNASWLPRDRLLVALGLLEPELDQNKTRLRWRCRCGDSLHSDILELCEGGIAELVDKMQQSSGVKVHVAPYNHQAGNRQYIVPRPDRWLRNAATKVGSALGRSWKSFSRCLPQHNEPCGTCATTPCASSNNLPPQQKTLHLSMCMDRTRRRKIVHQDRVDSFKTDRQLLCFLQKQYTAHSSRFPNLLRLKSVEKIVFVKYLLPMNGIVDVQRCNSTRPNQKNCYCIPPPKKVGVEYDYHPSPPKTHPPISPEYLASWFTCTKDIPKVDKDQECWILNRLPKRTCGVLEGRKEDPAEGWGIYFVEGWDRATITLTIFVIFLVASLLFGVLWSKFQFDIQGGFGVSAYMGTVCTLLIAVIVTQLENKE